MQWDKVKNILMIILLAVNIFLCVTIYNQYYTSYISNRQFTSDLSATLAKYGVSYNVEGNIEAQSEIMLLEVERNSSSEEVMANTLLTGEVTIEVAENGERLFSGDNGTVIWYADGGVYALFVGDSEQPITERQLQERAEEILESFGINEADGELEINQQESSVSFTQDIAHKQVYNRVVNIKFADGNMVEIEGTWTFGTPYAYVDSTAMVCNAVDMILEFTQQNETVNTINGISLGYQLIQGNSGVLQFVPTWQIETDSGLRYVKA